MSTVPKRAARATLEEPVLWPPLLRRSLGAVNVWTSMSQPQRVSGAAARRYVPMPMKSNCLSFHDV
jgi:hypothetical protein